MKRSSAFALLVHLAAPVLLGLFATAGASAQQATPPVWSVVASGGVVGASAGGSVMSGTVGQAIVGRVANSSGVAYQGFWYPRSAQGPSSVPVTGRPTALRTALGNFPNPFSSSTVVRYRLSERSNVRLEVYDRLGAVVRTIVDAQQSIGDHETSWDGLDSRGEQSPSGSYVLKISVDESGDDASYSEQIQIMLVR